ncbi:hypothetical protein [Actinomadura sp. WMMA1423]|uniref:hypothetical protein n=1 Tax=Actinomadura sp. WMMA1423 TaxID=2591108 RepID=UPI001146C003|nr:hypothetical protein [Actinomadura sp. WMMA1423]
MHVSVSSRDLARLGRDLQRAGRKDLKKEALKRMRRSVQPIAPEIKRAVKATPGGTSEGRSVAARAARPRRLRDATARGVQVKASLTGKYAGVRLRVDTRHFPDGEKNLPKYLEGTLPRWRSPSWGHDPWKVQRAHPYFFVTIRPHIPAVQAEVAKVIKETMDELGGGT